MYANDVSMSGYVIEDILIKFVTPRLCKESRTIWDIKKLEGEAVSEPSRAVSLQLHGFTEKRVRICEKNGDFEILL